MAPALDENIGMLGIHCTVAVSAPARIRVDVGGDGAGDGMGWWGEGVGEGAVVVGGSEGQCRNSATIHAIGTNYHDGPDLLEVLLSSGPSLDPHVCSVSSWVPWHANLLGSHVFGAGRAALAACLLGEITGSGTVGVLAEATRSC